MNQFDIYNEIQAILLQLNSLPGNLSNTYTIRKDLWEIPPFGPLYVTYVYQQGNTHLCDAGYSGIEEGSLEIGVFSDSSDSRRKGESELRSILLPSDKIYSGSILNTIWFDHITLEATEQISAVKSGQETPEVPGLLFTFRTKARLNGVH